MLFRALSLTSPHSGLVTVVCGRECRDTVWFRGEEMEAEGCLPSLGSEKDLDLKVQMDF